MMTRVAAVLLAVLFIGTSASAAEDQKGSKDHPFLPRMPGFYIEYYRDHGLTARNYPPKPGSPSEAVEGFVTDIKYYHDKSRGIPLPSSRQDIRKHYMEAVKKAGGQVLSDSESAYKFKIEKDGKVIWADISVPSPDEIGLSILEKGEMVQAISANAMLDALKSEGRIALYINFDFAQAVIRPDSRSTINEVVGLMKGNPQLRLSIEGHTDSVGDRNTNKRLSAARAKAVVDAVVAQGIAPDRLSAAGHGQERPIADNSTDEGRARNRRVELVNKDFDALKAGKGKDHPLFTRMPGYMIADHRTAASRAHRFKSDQGTTEISGKYYYYQYSHADDGKPGARIPSALEVVRNYVNATRKAGGKVVQESPAGATLVFSTQAGEIWAEVNGGEGRVYSLTIVEK